MKVFFRASTMSNAKQRSIACWQCNLNAIRSFMTDKKGVQKSCFTYDTIEKWPEMVEVRKYRMEGTDKCRRFSTLYDM